MRKWFLVLILCFPAAAPAVAAPVLLVLGDSLSAGYGMDPAAGWVELLRSRLVREGLTWEVINASVSGETSAGGRSRLPALLERHRPALVVIELGGNDGLRGLALAELKSNLGAMIDACKGAGARVLLVGMKLPPNYGPGYTTRFEQIYRDLAAEKQVAWVPYLLEGVGGDPAQMQPDRIHARPEAQPRLLENLWPGLEPLLKAAGAADGAGVRPG